MGSVCISNAINGSQFPICLCITEIASSGPWLSTNNRLARRVLFRLVQEGRYPFLWKQISCTAGIQDVYGTCCFSQVDICLCHIDCKINLFRPKLPSIVLPIDVLNVRCRWSLSGQHSTKLSLSYDGVFNNLLWPNIDRTAEPLRCYHNYDCIYANNILFPRVIFYPLGNDISSPSNDLSRVLFDIYIYI